MPDGPAMAIEKLRAARVPEPGVRSFERLLELALAGDRGLLPGDELEPVEDVPALADLSDADPADALDRTVLLKLNGGLGTTMGLDGPKSLVEVKPGVTFLDAIARGVLALRARHGARLPLLLMDSPTTREPSLAALAVHPGLAIDGIAPDFLQHVEPRLRADDLSPLTVPDDPAQEWCPPGHGDLYAALAASGTLAALREQGFRYAFASNADNLGAVLDARILAWFASSGAPFAMEVVEGTAADRKGGHVARRDGRLVLRETAQVPDGDSSFGDHARWRFYNANNLWLDLDQLAARLHQEHGVLPLPLIVNRKTVAGVEVLQLETAMGSVLAVFDGARILHVPRTRFAPVKSTEDLLLVRSDAYALADDGAMLPTTDAPAPYVELDPAFFKRLADFDARFPSGPPSLRRCKRLVVRGDVTFGADVTVVGDVTVQGPAWIADGTTLEGADG